MRLNNFCINLFSKLKAEGIKYAVLRNYAQLPNNTGASDLDIWIHRDDYIAFVDVLNGVSSTTNSNLVSFLPSDYCPKLCFLNISEGIQIDLFIGDISSKYGKLVSQSVILNHIIDYHGVSVIDDDFANLIAFIKEIVNNKKCNEKYCTPLFENSTIYSLNYLYDNLDFFTDFFIDYLYRFIQNGTDTNPGNKTFFPKAAFKHGRRPFYNYGSTIYRFLKSPGYVIAVIGTDGSGKSTIISGIAPILNEAFHNGIYYHHLRTHWLPDLGVLTGRHVESKMESVCSEPHSSEPSGFLGSLVRWGYYLIDYSLGYLRKIWFSKHAKSHVHIFDRYYYDYYIDPYRLRVSLPKWLIRIGGFIVPSPDIVLCLGGNPNIIYERKPETTLEEVTLQNERLKHFCNRQKNAIWIDTTQDVDKSVKEAMKAIHEMMARRFSNVTIK